MILKANCQVTLDGSFFYIIMQNNLHIWKIFCIFAGDFNYGDVATIRKVVEFDHFKPLEIDGLRI